MNKELKQKLRDALWGILDGNYDESTGICENANRNVNEDEYYIIKHYIESIFRIWPYYSGNYLYPIHTSNDRDESYQFWFEPLWEGEYGESRIQLVMFLLEQLGEPE